MAGASLGLTTYAALVVMMTHAKSRLAMIAASRTKKVPPEGGSSKSRRSRRYAIERE